MKSLKLFTCSIGAPWRDWLVLLLCIGPSPPDSPRDASAPVLNNILRNQASKFVVQFSIDYHDNLISHICTCLLVSL